MSELQVGDSVVLKVGIRKGQSGVVEAVRVSTVDVALPRVDNGPFRYAFEEVRKLLPAGTRVQFGDTGRTGVVVADDVNVDRPGGYAPDTWVSCERVRQDSDGRVLLWNAKAVKVLDEPEQPQWPAGTLVRYTAEDGNLHGKVGTTQEADDGSGYVTALFPERQSGRHDGHWTIKVENLERVHIVSHDELSVLEQANKRNTAGNYERAEAVLDKYLHPKVTRTFTVTVEQPADDNPVDGGVLEMVMKSDDSLAYPVTVISTEEGAR